MSSSWTGVSGVGCSFLAELVRAFLRTVDPLPRLLSGEPLSIPSVASGLVNGRFMPPPLRLSKLRVVWCPNCDLRGSRS